MMSDDEDNKWINILNGDESPESSDIEDPNISIARDDMLRRHIFNRSHDRINVSTIDTVINDYLSNPSDTFTIHNMDFAELPSILSTFSDIKTLRIVSCNLESLNNLPPCVEILDVRHNNITSVYSSDIPETLYELNLTKNKIEILDLSESKNITSLNVLNNPLTSVLVFPPNITELNLSFTGISSTVSIDNLSRLKILKLNNTNISNIDNLPNSILELSISRINFEMCDGVINSLPNSLIKFVAHCADIKRFAFNKFPIGLTELDVYNNYLTELPEVPGRMVEIDISNNNLTRITNIPKLIEKFDSRTNDNLVFTQEQKDTISSLKELPFVTEIYIDNDNEYMDDNIYNFMENKENYGMDMETDNVLMDSMMNTRINNIPRHNGNLSYNNIMDMLMRSDSISNLTQNDNFEPSRKDTHKIKHPKKIHRL